MIINILFSIALKLNKISLITLLFLFSLNLVCFAAAGSNFRVNFHVSLKGATLMKAHITYFASVWSTPINKFQTL